MSFHATTTSPLRTSRGLRRERHSFLTSPTTTPPSLPVNPELNLKSISDEECYYDSPIRSSHRPSLDSTSISTDQLSMNLSNSSFGSISHHSDHHHAMNNEFSFIGLPTAYPLHRQNRSSPSHPTMISSKIVVEEELEDFEMFRSASSYCDDGDERDVIVHQRSLTSLPEKWGYSSSGITSSDVHPTGDGEIRSLPPESPPGFHSYNPTGSSSSSSNKMGNNNSRHGDHQHHRHHRRHHHQRGSSSGSLGSLQSTISTSGKLVVVDEASITSESSSVASTRHSRRRHRHERNHSMGSKDFSEAILSDLFAHQCSSYPGP